MILSRVFYVMFFWSVVRTPAEAIPGNSHQSSTDPGLVRVRPALGHRFAYDTVRSEQHGGFKLPFSWDEGHRGIIIRYFSIQIFYSAGQIFIERDKPATQWVT